MIQKWKKNEFNKKLKQASFDYIYLNGFYNDKPKNNYDTKKLWNSMTTIQMRWKKNLKKYVNLKLFIENKNLFDLKDNLSKDNLCEFLVENFETILSELPSRQY